jgi:antitoxin VapB
MGAQLNIKSDDAYRLASELAALTGESLTAAVTAALRERLERERRERDQELAARRARIAALAAEIRASIPGPVSSADHNDLYGPDGLPA